MKMNNRIILLPKFYEIVIMKQTEEKPSGMFCLQKFCLDRLVLGLADPIILLRIPIYIYIADTNR